MYYARQRKITLNVPRVINPDRIRRRPYTKAEYKLNSRVEWLVMTIAHELRHAYQDQVTNTLYSRVSRKAMERDAERFELAQLEKWREWTKEQGL